ncbi:MAG TPA: hypothetical protein VFW12_00945 [Candidatus Limnocylindria bacterium]|nr:hypothetical protein [Candidatus Limnocylindria bacterium]
MVDHLPVAARPPRPRPHRNTLTLLVGRITTIKLAYWAAFTVFELALPRLLDAPPAQRLPYSVVAAVLLLAGAVAWARRSARAVDRRLGGLYRSAPTVATAFIAASVVASPASIPLLLVERARTLEGGCAPGAICSLAPILLWVAVLAAGTVLVPAAFALSMRGEDRAP